MWNVPSGPRDPSAIQDDRDAAVLRATVADFTKQAPLFYFILIVNSACLSYEFLALAPNYLALWLPLALWVACAVRIYVWSKIDATSLDFAAVQARLKSTEILSGVIGALFLIWTIALYPYGTAEARGQVIFFVGITAISGIFCLKYSRVSVILLSVNIVIPFALLLMIRNEASGWAIATNLILVSAVAIYMTINSARDFATMVRSRFDYARLSEANALLANTDVQTNLPNRRQFFSVFHRWANQQQKFSLGLIDLDGFKAVNDLHGHAVGDNVISAIGTRMMQISDENLIFARLGGDEFALLYRATSDSSLEQIGDAICSLLTEPFQGGSFSVSVSASIGLATFPSSASTEEGLYERADFAMRRAKVTAPGQFVIFSDRHEEELRHSHAVERCLRNADIEAEFFLLFQPLVDADCGRPVGFEALARWHNPELGEVSPVHFIPAAERIGIISNLSRILLKKALRALELWPAEIWISFNLSTRDLMSTEVVRDFIAIIEESGVNSARINLEVTESSLIDDFKLAQESLTSLKHVGVSLALDDFGTGYSSLSYVHLLPLDKIKVDRSFILGIESSGRSRDLVKGIIDLCATLNLDCVVEGMETSEQAQILRHLGCAAMQGYFFGKPMPESDTVEFLSDWHLSDTAVGWLAPRQIEDQSAVA